MPIYAYRCESCGFAKDVLQKISDAQLTQCPSCDQPTFKKQLTAAGFQLKGSGWYATDFRGGSAKPAQPAASAANADSKGASAPAADSAASAAPAATGGGTAPSGS
jgi:putative FmdB family regulatory protein